MNKEQIKAGLGILLTNKKMLDLVEVMEPVKIFTKKRSGMQKLLKKDLGKLYNQWLNAMSKEDEQYFFRLAKLLDKMIDLATDVCYEDEKFTRLEAFIEAYESGEVYEADEKTIKLTNSMVKDGIRKVKNS